MRRLLGLTGALALTAGTIVATAVPAAAATRFVRPAQSIQAAINAAGPNGTVIVKPGTYHENLTILQNGVRLFGYGATLLPPTTPAPSPCGDPDHPEDVTGICIAGNADANGNVISTVKNVRVTGFTIRNFPGIGIAAFGAAGTKITNNRIIDNGAYGIFANTSSNTLITNNVTANSEEAGIYVGDSPQANATVTANDASGNQSGIFVRNAEHGTISGNRLHANCAGVLFLADAPGPAGAFKVTGNVVVNNDKFCPPGDDGGPPLSGIGFIIAGGHDVTLTGNRIVDNTPSQPVPFAGGVVVLTVPPSPGAPPSTPPSHNTAIGNVIHGNKPDINWDGTGTGNVFRRNILCRTSTPAGLCA